MNSAELPGMPLLSDTIRWAVMAAPYLGLAVFAAGGLWGWVVRSRIRRARAALGQRTVVEIVPTNSFDPGEGEVGRFSHHLGRARYAASDVPARGAAVRLRYSADGGRMRCFLEGPAQAAAVLSMPGFAEVEVRSTRPGIGIAPVRFDVPAQREVAQ